MPADAPIAGAFRSLLDAPAPGAINMARDAAVLEQVAAGTVPPTIRIYRWSQPTVTIGYGQRPADVVNLAACAADSVPIIRRMSGGGAVLHAAEITYSIMVPRTHGLVCADFPDSFAALCRPLVAALRQVGVPAIFKPVNDLLVGGHKISGCAQVRRGGGVLQHGTVLLDADPALMQRYLRRPETPKPHSLQLTDLRREYGAAACTNGFVRQFAAMFFDRCASSWQVTVSPGAYTPVETARAQHLEAAFFARPGWNQAGGRVGPDRHRVDLD